MVKTDAYGNMMWSQTYGGPNRDEALAVVQTVDEGFALAGKTQSFGAGDYDDILLVKTDEHGITPEFPSRIRLLIIAVTVVALLVIYRCRLPKHGQEKGGVKQ